MARWTLSIVSVLAVCVTAAHAVDSIQAGAMLGMLEEENRLDAFRNMDKIFPVEVVHRSDKPFHFKEAPQDLSGVEFEWQGAKSTLEAFLEKTITTALVVVKDDAIVFERYALGNTRDSNATSMSVAKSFTSALVGIAIDEGLIESIDDPIEQYVPELKESGYAGVTIKQILQMSSGIDFSEVYDDQTSDIILMMGQLAGGKSIVEYAAALESNEKPGAAFNYASIDTNVLGMLLRNVTKESPAKYLEEKIWKRIGMESDATWATDNQGNVLAFAWLNVTARDFAKFGRLYLNEGRWNGEQVVPANWVKESVVPDADYLKLTDHYAPGWDIGYQYQWWVPAGNEGEFMAIGVWGQYIYVNPTQNLIIVKNSVDPDFDARDMETVAAFRAIGRALK